MFLNSLEPERGRMTSKQGTPTVYTTTPTTLASQGGLLINIDSATGDIPQTASGWIEDEKYGSYHSEFASSTSAEFDTAVTRTGGKTLKLSTLDATGRARRLLIPAANYSTATTNLTYSAKLIPCKASTKYKFSCFAKTTNVVATSVSISVTEIGATGTAGVANGTNTLSGTQDWTLLTTTFTTAGTATRLGLGFFISVAGNISDAWFDVNSMTLEEVVEPRLDTIDQMSLVTGAVQGVGFSSSERYWAQAFTPTQANLAGIALRKEANVGTPTSDVTFNIYTNNAGNPSTTAVSTDYTITSAVWDALTVGEEFIVPLPATLTPATQYWIRYSASGTLDGVNYRLITRSTSGTLSRYSTDGSAWSTPGAARTFYHKTYYSLPVPSSATPSIQSFTAVGSTDNIDQSQLTVNGTNVLGNAAVAYFYQQFLPTKSKLTGVVVQREVNTGTFVGDVVLKIRNDNAGSPGTTVLASYTIPNATWNALAIDTDYTVNLPCNLTVDGSTKYWIQIGTTTADAANYTRINLSTTAAYSNGLCKYGLTENVIVGTYTGDLYFKTLYYKPTTNFKASQNNQSVSISADEDGFAEGSVISLTTGAFTWGLGATPTDLLLASSVYSATAGSGTAVGSQTLISNYGFYNYASYNWIGTPATANTQDLIWKITTKLPITGDVTVTFRTIERTTGTTTMDYSLDNSTYTNLGTLTNSANSEVNYTYTITGIEGETDFFLRFRRAGASSKQDITNLAIATTVDTSGVNTLYNYPTNKDVTEYYTTTLSAPTTSATYRATKWGFPAIEYSATEYQYLNIDTTATASVVQFSEAGAIFTTVADGASLAISSTSNPLLWVRVNITANRIYLSSNDGNAVSDKDGSMKQSVVFQVVQP